jgi:hypothetical protein
MLACGRFRLDGASASGSGSLVTAARASFALAAMGCPPMVCRRINVADQKYPPLPKVGPIGYASVVDVQAYAPWLKIGPHLPGVRDVALWTTDQMRAYVDADRAARGVPAPDISEVWLTQALKLIDVYARAREGRAADAMIEHLRTPNAGVEAMDRG